MCTCFIFRLGTNGNAVSHCLIASAVVSQGVVPVSKADYIPVSTAPSLSAKAAAAKSAASTATPMMAAWAMLLLLALLL